MLNNERLIFYQNPDRKRNTIPIKELMPRLLDMMKSRPFSTLNSFCECKYNEKDKCVVVLYPHLSSTHAKDLQSLKDALGIEFLIVANPTMVQVEWFSYES